LTDTRAVTLRFQGWRSKLFLRGFSQAKGEDVPAETDQKTVKKLGKYEIIELVGRGAMGEVYKAQDPLIGRLVALKTITSGLAGRPDLLERFYQEARSAGTLQHPNIVTVYELGQEGETPFIAMEFLEGETLEHVIERRPVMALSHKLSHIVPVCRALNFAHKRGVVHRDIKPANVMITKDGRVKVVDFGIARQADSSMTQTDTIIGTLGYMSPQQIRGERADERSDIWSTGVMLYELLTYHRPFEGANQAALMMNIVSDDVMPASIKNFAPDAGPQLESLVHKMLAKNSAQRYQNMDNVLRDFESIVKRLGQRSQGAAGLPLASGGDLLSPAHEFQMSSRGGAIGATVISGAPLAGAAGTNPGAEPSGAAVRSSHAPSLVEKLEGLKKPILIGLSVIALIVILNLVQQLRHMMAPDKAETVAAPAETLNSEAAPAAPEAVHAQPIAPGVVATVAELAQPWAAKGFVYRNDATGESTPAMVVHLPRGGYWGFSLVEPYGRCKLEFVTDLQKLAKDYDYPADHPMVADPCSSTLFDLMRYGGPMGAEVRGDIVHGSALRPPVAIEIQQRGNSVVALKMEE
jgi:hypothetical protein